VIFGELDRLLCFRDALVSSINVSQTQPMLGNMLNSSIRAHGL
jgi:hypothetical protein